MKFEVRNRYSDKVQFVAEIDCPEGEQLSVKLGLAVKWAIKNKVNLSGANLSDADLSRAYLSGADLSRADLSGAHLSRADLSRADLSRAYLSCANLSRADLSGADLSGADLSGADLSGAYLSSADLSRANLSSAYLSGADLGSQWIIQGGHRSDGWPFFLQRLTNDKEPIIKAGCRYFTIAEAQTHWEMTRGNTPLGKETRAIVRAMVDTMHIRGLK